MLYRWLADAVVVVHGAFILFVVVGGLLLLRWPRLAWLHLPAVVWGVWIEFSGWICPLTPLENRLRLDAGVAGYGGGFIAHYLLPLIYPPYLNPALQYLLGAIVLLINGTLYGWLWWRRKQETDEFLHRR